MPPLMTRFTLTRSANAIASRMSCARFTVVTSGSLRSMTGTSASRVQSTVLSGPAF